MLPWIQQREQKRTATLLKFITILHIYHNLCDFCSIIQLGNYVQYPKQATKYKFIRRLKWKDTRNL